MKIKELESMLVETTNNFTIQNKSKKYANINLEELEFIKRNIGLTVGEKEFLFDILNYISIGTNLIVNEEGDIANQQQISSLLHLDVRNLQRKFKTLMSKKIIHNIKNWNNVYYILNPYLFNCGVTIDQAYELFDAIGYNRELSLKNSVILNNKPTPITKEKILELIIVDNLDCIEDGLSLIKPQYEVENGFIDILAEDKNGVKTIIEIKLKSDDPKIIEQCIYYPTQFSEKVRTISIAPDYSNKISSVLKSLSYVEMKTFEIENGQIQIHDYV